MEKISFLIIYIACGVLFIHIMSYTFLLDNNRIAVIMEVLKLILSCVLLFYLYKIGIISGWKSKRYSIDWSTLMHS